MAFIASLLPALPPVGVHRTDCPNVSKLAAMRQLRLAHPDWSEKAVFFAMLQSRKDTK